MSPKPFISVYHLANKKRFLTIQKFYLKKQFFSWHCWVAIDQQVIILHTKLHWISQLPSKLGVIYNQVQVEGTWAVGKCTKQDPPCSLPLPNGWWETTWEQHEIKYPGFLNYLLKKSCLMRNTHLKLWDSEKWAFNAFCHWIWGLFGTAVSTALIDGENVCQREKNSFYTCSPMAFGKFFQS